MVYTLLYLVFIWKIEIFVLPLLKIKYICCYKIVKIMEVLFVLMIMFSFGLLGIGINKYINDKPKKKNGIINWDKPKEIWKNDVEDFRYYAKRK